MTTPAQPKALVTFADMHGGDLSLHDLLIPWTRANGIDIATVCTTQPLTLQCAADGTLQIHYWELQPDALADPSVGPWTVERTVIQRVHLGYRDHAARGAWTHGDHGSTPGQGRES